MLNSITDKFDSFILNNKISHAYLIELRNYDSDYKIVLNFIKMILSNMKYSDVINSDLDYFKQIDDGNYVDLFVVEPDGNSIKKQQLLNLQEEFSNKSLLDNKRIYIIKECEKLNDSSANTMLKFLEEPNENIIAILLTNNRYKVIDTIISRCQILSINSYSEFNNDEEKLDLLDSILSTRKLILNYNYIYDNYFVDKNISKNNLLYLQKLLISHLDKSFENSKLKNIKDDIIVKLVLVIESEIKKLDYNVNHKLWFDCLIVNLMEVLV